jgi:hypothetical protein
MMPADANGSVLPSATQHQPSLTQSPPTAAVQHLKLQDPALLRWEFFMQRYYHDTPAQIEQRRDVFLGALQDALEWVDGSASTITLPSVVDRRQSIRVKTVDWRPHGNEFRSLEARILFDTHYIQVGCAQDGLFTPDVFTQLQESVWSFEEASTQKDPLEDTRLGYAVCLQASWTKDHAELDAAQAQELARTMIEKTLGRRVDKTELHQLAFGYLIVPRREAAEAVENICVLLVKDDKKVLEDIGHLCHRLMPRLMLTQSKGQYLLKLFEERLSPESHELEAKLRTACKQSLDQMSRLTDLESSNHALAQQLGEVSATMLEQQELSHTLRTNLRNIDILLEDPVFAPCRKKLGDWLTKWLQLGNEQIETDLQYLRGTWEWGTQVVQSLGTMVQARLNRWQRRTQTLVDEGSRARGHHRVSVGFTVVERTLEGGRVASGAPNTTTTASPVFRVSS